MKRNFEHLIKQGFNPTEIEMEWLWQEMGRHMTDQILSVDVFSYALSDLKLWCREYGGRNLYTVADFCSAVWQLQKTGLDFRKIHNQFRLIPFDESNCRDLWFFVIYLRYAKVMQKAHESGEYFEGYKDYIPNNVVLRGVNEMYSYYSKFERAVDQAKYNSTVVDLSKQYGKLEMDFECNGERYIVRVPHSSKEIVDEAHYMRNCIAGRMHEYCRGDWVYAFIRKADDPEMPFIDALVATGKGCDYFGPVFVITQGHVNVMGTPNEAVFYTWYDRVENLIRNWFDVPLKEAV